MTPAAAAVAWPNIPALTTAALMTGAEKPKQFRFILAAH
jgi:hypothetical protein